MNYEKFFFYNSYWERAQMLNTEQRKEFLLAVMYYGTEGVYQITDPMVELLFIQAKTSIDASKKRYERAVKNGKKGGRRKRPIKKEWIREWAIRGYEAQEIAEMHGISLKTLYRILPKKTYDYLNENGPWIRSLRRRGKAHMIEYMVDDEYFG